MSSTPPSTPPAPIPFPATPDLVPIRDAARMVDRSLSTVRAWIASGDLTAYHGTGTHPGNRPVLVSRAELAIAVVAGTKPRGASPIPRPKVSNPNRPPPVAATMPAVDLAELATVRAERDLARVELLAVHDLVDALRLVIRATDDRARDLATALEAERARTAGMAAELDALRGAAGLPWWRRLLGGGVSTGTPRLPSDGEA